MRLDMITLACGAAALVLYFSGHVVPAAGVAAAGVVVLIYAVLRR
ncbi:hypothetical protein [Devosia sp.]|nr:hypothetical protein [Devosia sp.]